MAKAQTLEMVCAGDINLVTYAWKLKKRGNADSTIEHRCAVLRKMKTKGCDLLTPDSVETMLAVEPLTKSQKYSWAECYNSFVKTMKLSWEKPRCHYEPKQPFMPTHEELTSLISAANKQTATFLQVALTTGARCGEIAKLQWIDINSENNTINVNDAEKGSRNRTVKVPEKTIAMVNALPKKHAPYVFNPNSDSFRSNVCNLRKRLANNQKNPRFLQIHLHTFRHFFATETLRQTKMLTHVQYLLGHKSVVNTERYTHLIDYSGEKYYSAVATNLAEGIQIAEDGWTYFQEFDGVKVFRKPK